ncbi:[protein-PII] uridylyltransferase [Pseudomarimonas salicorniae]|uniref:Bifunctional uridylyltransferase/uridylyl-removing enzyme n=1 Tax=Pseudomarimonas salicorniae TaxID=2933270 RepID=A0ABT0GL31_9GAMM|nr:[protein-PII] uridylyltransferase [Lysobacter sp. CAU 1642]MCK7595237.1 [protein-PII] uridylyltransferase [Lysobacter sp. CAU 1642]
MALSATGAIDLEAAAAAGWRDSARELLANEDRELAVSFDAGAGAEDLLLRRCRAVDQVVKSAWRQVAGEPAGLSLLATGGYGRRELYPHSDIDLLVVGEPADQDAGQSAIQGFLAALWDIGLQPGHASRSVRQCAEEAAGDLTIATALLDARMLVGEMRVLEALRVALSAPDIWPAAAFFEGKREELRQRHARYNDTAYNLEPNLKEGPGGLRDLHTLAWMAKRLYGVHAVCDLQPIGLLGADEAHTVSREYWSLCRLRIGLHLTAGRREERLLFEHQTALAKRLGLRDEHRENLAVEQLMQSYFRSAALVMRLSERLLQRFEESLSGEVDTTPIDEHFELAGGYLRLRDPIGFEREPLLMLELFAVWHAQPAARGLHSATAQALGEALDHIDDAFRQRPEARAKFMQLVRLPDAADTLARMSHLGVLGRYLPAFGRVAGRMQYDLFHVYTVDQHTLTVLRNIASFRDEGSKQRFSLAYEIWPRLRKPELLLLGGLFHDIAKGRGGDHSELGAEDARRFCTEHGLSQGDTDLVAWLVEKHLAMSITAQREDIADPEVISRFARLVGERERLDYLYLLTVADIAGTSPKLWNAWKDRLLADLYGATRFALRRGLRNVMHAEERIAEAREEARAVLLSHGMDESVIDKVWSEFPSESFLRYRPAQLVWQTLGIAAAPGGRPLALVRPHQRPGALEVFVYCPDTDGLFAAVTATLDRLGLNVVEARVVTSTRGMSLDTFQVLDAGSEFISPERRAATVAESLCETLAKSPLQVNAVRRAIPRQLKHFRVPLRVEFNDNDAGRTEMSLVCADRPGLLAQVSAVFREEGLRVHDARIATFGERVEDFFQLSDEHDNPLSEAARDSLCAALAEVVDEGRK